jgi:hypothetical protein
MRFVLAATVAALGMTVSTPPADAQGVVHVCSRFGKGCISGPTRRARFGLEVRMPGGTWISCAGDCRATLRDETVDFWETRALERGRRR